MGASAMEVLGQINYIYALMPSYRAENIDRLFCHFVMKRISARIEARQ